MNQPPAFLKTALAALFLGATALLSAPAHADWSGKGQLGVVVASGNSESRAGSAKLGLVDKSGDWTNQFDADAVYASDNVGTTAQRWELKTETDYRYDPGNYVFGGLRYEDDRYSGFNYQATASAGIGHQFLKSDATSLSGQVGAGYKVSDSRLPENKVTALALIASADFHHAFNASTTLLDKVSTEYTTSNTYAQNDIGVEVKMSAKLALSVAYQVRYNTDPPPAFKKVDTLTTVNVVYEVK